MAGKSIEKQISELTEEQKINILEKGKRFCIVSIVCYIVMFMIIGGWFVLSSVMIEGAEANVNMLKTKLDLGIGEHSVVLNQWLDAIHVHGIILDVCSAVNVVIAVAFLSFLAIRIILFKKKYPYYSDRRYSYLKKAEKAKNKISNQ